LICGEGWLEGYLGIKKRIYGRPKERGESVRNAGSVRGVKPLPVEEKLDITRARRGGYQKGGWGGRWGGPS